MNKKEDKQTKKKNHKALKITLIVLVTLITLGIATFIVLDILISDKSKCSYVDKGITNSQIIDTRYLEGLSHLTDNFEFKLGVDDINQMLSNSMKEESISKYPKNAYLEQNEDNFKWCFDLNTHIFDTRLVISTHIESMGNSSKFLIDSITIGKLNASSYLQRGGYISNDGFNSLFSNASLPIESHLESGYFLYEPLKFVNMFNLGEVTSELFTKVNSPERLSVETDSIGFKLNLEGIRVASPAEIGGSYNLPGELEAITSTNEVYNSLTSGEETPVLEVSEENFSKWIKDSYTSEAIETIEGELINTKVTANIAKVEAMFTNNELIIKWTIKLGKLYFEVSESLGDPLGTDEGGFIMSFDRPLNESGLQIILMDDFIDNLTKTQYVTYDKSGRNLLFDFSNVAMTTKVDNFTDKKVTIINNKLTFFLTKNL